MTADVELLPLPEHTEAGEFTFDAHVFEHMDMVSYARANVAHATAAKDAEIEALREMVGQEQDYAAGAARRVLMAQIAQRRAEARAERLAEALREAYGQVRELCDCYGHAYPEASFARYEALLRDQEVGNG